MNGLLFSQMEPPDGWEAKFHDWYENHHIPARMAIPGFASATRYEAVQGEPRYLACYFLEDMAGLDAPAYRELKARPDRRTEEMLGRVRGFTRYICDEISDTGAPIHQPTVLFVVTFAVPDADDAQFEDWYAGEHVPLLMQVPGWLRVRRYRVRPGGEGPPWTHFALHELEDATALERPERQAARDTPRRDALAIKPWFGTTGRWLYRPFHTVTADHPTVTQISGGGA
ncbi:MAG: hypothetical protein WAK93_18740 [Solirubrobacteraceae bacterium]